MTASATHRTGEDRGATGTRSTDPAQAGPAGTGTGGPPDRSAPGRRPGRGRRTDRGRGTDRGRRTGFSAFSHGFLILWAVMAAGPLLWAVMTSFKPSGQILESPWSLPASPHWRNFADAWTTADLGRDLLNTVLVVGCSVVGSTVLASMAAYVLARFVFPGSLFIQLLFMSGMSAPVVLALVPLFFVLKGMALLNTFPGLVLVYIAYSLPFSVFFLTSFFRSLPASAAEAALLDGASHLRILFQVMVPMARPGLVSVAMFNLLGLWNQYLIPQMINPDPDRFVLTQGLASLAVHQGYKGDWGALFAGLTLASLPQLAFYVLFRRHVESGLLAGAVK
ncbi:carbohydrate ABC transporter permease [Streptomyces sp. NPDC056161]|uniref:carbohydrate ABC transporter permease n=1 Tax=Streptomyces sp. NPDC056161 TaxID=3345732 RepID=UPI0035D6FCC6